MAETAQEGSSQTEAARARMRDAVQRLEGLLILPPVTPVQNVDALVEQEWNTADRVAIWFARLIGSWRYVISLGIFLAIWTVLNVVAWMEHWDPYPFILMSLLISLHGAFTAPLILMAQNREAAKDRLMMREDYETNQRAAEAVERTLAILEQHGSLLGLLVERHYEGPHAGPNGEERDP